MQVDFQLCKLIEREIERVKESESERDRER